jgi:hypothetical protein
MLMEAPMCSRRSKTGWAVAMLLVCLIAHAASSEAAPILANLVAKDEPKDFGNLAQGATKCPQVNCGATALVNSFVFLQKKYPKIYGSNLIGNKGANPTQKELVAAADNLSCTFLGNCQPGVIAVGTPIGDFILGKQDYFTANAPNTTTFEAQITETWGNPIVVFHKGQGVLNKPAFVADGTKPTAQFLYDQLKAGEDVEIVVRGPRVNHYLTLTGIDWDPNKNTGKINVIDPATGRPTAPLSMALFTMGPNNGFLGTNYDNFAGAVVLDAVAESPTQQISFVAPEPASATLVATAITALGFLCIGRNRRRCRYGSTSSRLLG